MMQRLLVILLTNKNVPEAILSNRIVRCDRQRMSPENLTVFPVSKLADCYEYAATKCHQGQCPAESVVEPCGISNAPNQSDDQANHWNVGKTISHRLLAGLDDADDRNERPKEPEES